MKNFFKNILNKPLHIRIAIILASYLIPSLLFWQYILNDDINTILDLNEQIETNDSKIAYNQNLTKNFNKVFKEKNELEEKLKTAVAELPDSKEIPELLLQISNLVKESNLDIELFQPTGEELDSFYAKVPVSIYVKGTFHDVLKFFNKVGRLQRIVNINNVKMYNPEIKDNSMIISAECIATTYRFLSKEEKMAIQSEKGQKNIPHNKRY